VVHFELLEKKKNIWEDGGAPVTRLVKMGRKRVGASEGTERVARRKKDLGAIITGPEEHIGKGEKYFIGVNSTS